MCTSDGLNISIKTAAMLVDMSEDRGVCRGPNISDTCNALHGKQNSITYVPIVALAVKYAWLVQGDQPISATKLGYEGPDPDLMFKPRQNSGNRSGVADFSGICPAIKKVIISKWTHMARLPGTCDDKDPGGEIPRGTTVWPRVTDDAVMAVLEAAWLQIADDIKKALLEGREADDATVAASKMGKNAWQGMPDRANGAAAKYIRNRWTHSDKSGWNPTKTKKGLLDKLNGAPAPAPAPVAAPAP